MKFFSEIRKPRKPCVKHNYVTKGNYGDDIGNYEHQTCINCGKSRKVYTDGKKSYK